MKNLLVLLALMAAPGGGQQACITVTTDHSSYFLGENVLLHFSVENTGKGPLTVEMGGDYRGAPRSLRFKVEAFDEQGHLLEDPHPNPMCFGGLGGKIEVKPDKPFVASLALAHYRRIPKEGKYRIVVRHDLGWKTAPSATTELEFKQPSPAQAVLIVEAMGKSPTNQGVSWGQKTPPYRDFWTLSYPVYLQPLTVMATPEALQGIGQIPSAEAIPSLLKLAHHPKLQLEAAKQLCLRLPDRGKPRPGFGSEERRRLASRGWNPRYTAPVRALALELIGLSDELISQGAFMLARVGQAEDLPRVLASLNRHLPAVSSYPRPGGPGYQLEQTVAALPWPKNCPSQLGSAYLLKKLLKKPASAELIQQGLQDPSARVRELAVLAITSGGESYRAQLIPLLKDADPGVQVAACDKLAGDPAILELVRSTPDEWVLRAAANASTARHRWECAQILADRLVEKERWLVTFQTLADQVLTRVPGNSSNGAPEDSELKTLRAHWHQFLADHKSEIESGKTFARLPADLIPGNFQFSP